MSKVGRASKWSIGGVNQVFRGRMSSLEERKELWAMEKNIPRKKRERKQYHLSYNIQAVGKNIKCEGDENLGEANQDLKNWDGKEYQAVGNFIHPSIKINLI